jgi:hypothetical protein
VFPLPSANSSANPAADLQPIGHLAGAGTNRNPAGLNAPTALMHQLLLRSAIISFSIASPIEKLSGF